MGVTLAKPLPAPSAPDYTPPSIVERLFSLPSAAQERVAALSFRLAGLTFARRRADLLLAVTLAVAAGLVGAVGRSGLRAGSYYQ